MLLVWAVDAGGTKTHGVLADTNGDILAERFAGPCNLSMVGTTGCKDILAGLLQTTCVQADVTPQQIDYAFFALAGLDTDEDREQLSSVLTDVFAGTGVTWQLENDVYAALLSGTLGEPGVVLLAGTGSMAMGQTADGRLFRCGGWGQHICGDPGSAYDVGHRLLIHILGNYDAGLAPDLVTQLAMAKAGADTPPGIIDWIEDTDSPLTRIAALAQVVDQAATSGQEAAQVLLKETAAALVDHLFVLADRMAPLPAALRVVLAGGMFNSAIYKNSVIDVLHAAGDRWQPLVPDLPPVGGAYVGALRLANVAITPQVMARFSAGIQR